MVDKVAYNFDPFELVGEEKPSGKLRQIKKEICDFVRDEVLSFVGSGKSPVKGGAWKRTLSPEYKKQKAKKSSALFANMELTGDMLDSLECVAVGENLELRIKGKQADKADGHNNHTGRSRLPRREFIPKENQTFKEQILQGIREIIANGDKE